MAYFDKAGIRIVELSDLLDGPIEVVELPLKPVMERVVSQRWSDGKLKPHGMSGISPVRFFIILDFGGEHERGLGKRERYKAVGVSQDQEVADVELEEGGNALPASYVSFEEAVEVAGDLNEVSRIHEM